MAAVGPLKKANKMRSLIKFWRRDKTRGKKEKKKRSRRRHRNGHFIIRGRR